MSSPSLAAEIDDYITKLEGVLSRFTQDRNGIHIADGDDGLLRQCVRELMDLFDDSLGPSNAYSVQIADDFNVGVTNFFSSPSYKSVENILASIRAARTRFARNIELSQTQRNSSSMIRRRENVFIIHGRDEAKWRELKDILKSQFKLNPIVLFEQPDAGSETVIEKFERFAHTCSYAMAVFTPDDEVKSGGITYLQARPNVIYELGWFCGKIGRKAVMLLLKDGTSMFSDFGGIIQKRFVQNIAEKVIEIRRDLEAAGVLDK